MNPEDSKSLDIFGVRPAAKAVDRATEASLAGAGAFLSRICLPAAEEFGLLLKDRVGHWRAKNAAKITEKAEKLTANAKEPLEAHPRLAWEIIEKGSWADDEAIQNMWAGLWASSCRCEKDDSNVLFAGLLEQLTCVQVKILSHACEVAPKYVSSAGFPYTEELKMPLDLLSKVSGISDLHRLDRELDHLRSLELIGGGNMGGGGFSPNSTIASVAPTALALHLYVRSHGFVGSPVEYWKLKEDPAHSQQPKAVTEINSSRTEPISGPETSQGF